MRAAALLVLAVAGCAASEPPLPRASVLSGDELRICLSDGWSDECAPSEAVVRAEGVVGFARRPVADPNPYADLAFGTLLLAPEAARRLRGSRSPYATVSVCGETAFWYGPRFPAASHPTPLPVWMTEIDGEAPGLMSNRFGDLVETAVTEGCEAFLTDLHAPPS